MSYLDIKLSVIIPAYNMESLIERALKSVPARDDIEIIVIDDGSSDDTWSKILMTRAETDNQNMVCLYNKENRGVSYTVNKGLDVASGEYVVLLGSDDYFYTDELEKALNQLDGTDLVYFNLQVNSGEILRLTEDTKQGLCGSTKFMRREFVGDTRNPEDKRQGEDWFFFQDLMKKNPSEKFTDITLKHYNYPRKGSLTDMARRGKKWVIG